jgi:hypothetical protein
VLMLSKSSSHNDLVTPRTGHKSMGLAPVKSQHSALRMKLVAANLKSETVGIDQLPGKSNYFIGNDPKKWRTNIPNYAKVRYGEIYPGVDIVYYGNQSQLEYDFIIAPHSNPNVIKLSFVGAQKIHIDQNGDLVLRLAGGEQRQLDYHYFKQQWHWEWGY